MFIMIKAEHIWVDPKDIKPVLKLVMLLKLMVLVTVCFNVYLLIKIMPSASKNIAIYISYLSDSFLLT